MTVILKQIFGLFKLLNSDKGEVSIAAGLTLGWILGLSPILSLQGVLVILLMLFLRVQVGAALIAAFFFAFIGFLLDPIFDVVGQRVLEEPSLLETWTTLYQMPIVPMTRFNNSIVMGAGLTAIVLSPFMFLFFKTFVRKYRATVVERFQNFKAFKAFKMTGFYKWYAKYDQLFG